MRLNPEIQNAASRGQPRTGVRGRSANSNVSFVFEEYRPPRAVRQTLLFHAETGRNRERSEVGRLRTNVQFCCVKAQLMQRLKRNVGSLQSKESCPAVKSLIKSWFRYESSL